MRTISHQFKKYSSIETLAVTKDNNGAHKLYLALINKPNTVECFVYDAIKQAHLGNTYYKLTGFSNLKNHTLLSIAALQPDRDGVTALSIMLSTINVTFDKNDKDTCKVLVNINNSPDSLSCFIYDMVAKAKRAQTEFKLESFNSLRNMAFQSIAKLQSDRHGVTALSIMVSVASLVFEKNRVQLFE